MTQKNPEIKPIKLENPDSYINYDIMNEFDFAHRIPLWWTQDGFVTWEPFENPLPWP